MNKIAYIALRSSTDNKCFLGGLLLLIAGLSYALGFGGLVAGFGVTLMMVALVYPADWDKE
jgi:hypothetical protein